MSNRSIIVRAEYDAEAGVWVASTSDISGLSVESDSFEGLQRAIAGAVADLIDLNGFDTDLPEVAMQVLAQNIIRIPVAA